MPNVTGTNFILATDLSGVATVVQTPTNGAVLPLGTNVVIIAVADPYGNTAYSTNQVVVEDETPPVIWAQPQSQTNFAGSTTSLSVVATACTPLAFQWFFDGAAMGAQTNASLVISNVAAGAAGNYAVAVTAAGGSVTSAVAVLTVSRLPAGAAVVSLGSSANPCGFKDDLIFTARVTPTNATGTVQFLTNGSAFDVESLAGGSAASIGLATLSRGTNLITALYSGDDTYPPATNTLAQVVTNHPPVVSPAYYSLVAGRALSIAVTNLATNWSDADGDALFIASISPSTNGVVVTNALPNLYYANANYVNDLFVCAISDGFGGTNFQTVYITVVAQTNTTPVVALTQSRSTGLTLQLGGAAGATYVLKYSTNLAAGVWVPLATNVPGLSGIWQYTNTQATSHPDRFFRLQLVTP